MVVPHRIGGAAADPDREECEDGEDRQLKRKAERQKQRSEARRKSRSANEDQEEAGRDQLGDQQDHAAD